MTSQNRALQAAARFHAATCYVRANGAPPGQHIRMGVPPDDESAFWREDPTLEPRPYKSYATLPRLELSRVFEPVALPALDALRGCMAIANGEVVPDRAMLGRLALFSDGLLNRQSQLSTGRVVDYRTAGATGARYHLELYFACGDLPDLGAGVYHYASDEHCLRPLRTGDLRAVLVEASGDEPALAHAPVIVALTSTFWRNAYTYKARAYRHAFWDSGTTLANLIGVATALGLATQVVLGFADQAVNRLLGVDGIREAALVLCAVGQTRPPAPPVSSVTSIDHPVRPLSTQEVEFPAITEMHQASTLHSGDEAAAWRADPVQRAPLAAQGEVVGLRPVAIDRRTASTMDEVILARRSTRHYDTATPLLFESLSTLLQLSSQPIGFDCLHEAGWPLHDEYLIVNGVDGLRSGAYVHHVGRGELELLRAGDFRHSATRLAVNQTYAGDAHVNVYYLADLDAILERYGNRGYRLAQLESALCAGRLNLAAHALGLGGVGSTAYDEEVVRFFSPHATGKSYLFVTVVGVRRRRREGDRG